MHCRAICRQRDALHTKIHQAHEFFACEQKRSHILDARKGILACVETSRRVQRRQYMEQKAVT